MMMTFNHYDAELKRFEGMPNTKLTADYGVTLRDMERMEEEPEKYVSFLMYLSTRPWYSGEEEKEFLNADALSCDEATEWIQDILYDAVELYEDEEEEGGNDDED